MTLLGNLKAALFVNNQLKAVIFISAGNSNPELKKETPSLFERYL
jgi:hypothetical protein